MARPKLDADGAVRLDEDLGTVFDDVLDELHSKTSPSRNQPTRKELDDLEAEDRRFRAALANEVNERMRSQGVRIRAVRLDPEDGQSYLVDARDNQGRPFEAKVSFDEALTIGQQYQRDMGRRIIELLCERILHARQTYFLRMK